MVWKKQLITLMCVLGILGLGSCMLFVPPVIVRRPIPKVHSVKVVVAEDKAIGTLIASDLRDAIADRINDPKSKAHFRALKTEDEGPGDATLTVTVRSGKIHEPDSHWSTRTLAIVSDIHFFRNDGKVLWDKTEFQEDTVWSSEMYNGSVPVPAHWNLRFLADDLVEKLVYAVHFNPWE